MPVRLAIAGASGRMGRALIDAALQSRENVLAAALEQPGSAALGRDAGDHCGRRTGIAIESDLGPALARCDVLIDFTCPEGTLAHLAACERAGIGAVIGTTGLDTPQKERLVQAGRRIPLVFAPNMSVGVNVLLELVRIAAGRLAGFDIEIVEMHHRNKVDAPSGTALALGEAAAAATGVALADHALYSREGVTGVRRAGTIGFAALRGGDVVGEHTVIFAGVGERIELTHKASSRENFAAGALRAARFVADARARGDTGVFDMHDVLDLPRVGPSARAHA